jgi:hypothetical protein
MGMVELISTIRKGLFKDVDLLLQMSLPGFDPVKFRISHF